MIEIKGPPPENIPYGLVDLSGNTSRFPTTDKVSSLSPNSVYIINPSVIKTNTGDGVTFFTTTFEEVNTTSPHLSTDWEILSSDYISIVDSSYEDTVNLTSFKTSLLQEGNSYYIRVRYTNEDNLKSDWGAEFFYQVIPNYVITPHITNPLDSQTNIGESITIRSSVFQTFSDADTLYKSSWQLATDLDFSNIVQQSLDDESNLTAWVVNGLSPNTNYYVRVAYDGLLLTKSSWSEPVRFRTKVSFVIPTITGPSTLSVNQSADYIITNYDPNIPYTLSCTVGHVSRTGNTIHYTAPNVSGIGGFTLITTNKSVNIVSSGINTPSITSPLNDSININPTITLISSAYINAKPNNTHYSSTWEIARDTEFTNIFSRVVDSRTNLTSLAVSGLSSNTTYYARIRHKSNIGEVSGWSTTLTFTTKATFIEPILSGPSSLIVGQTGEYIIVNYDNTINYTVSATSGSVHRTNNVIIYTAGNIVGSFGFKILYKDVSVNVTSPITDIPTIISPVDQQQNIGSSVTITTTAFHSTGISDTHQSSTWYIATDANFTQDLQTFVDSTTNKTTLTLSNLVTNKTYYIKVRHKGNVLGYSGWSVTKSFTTKITFVDPIISGPATLIVNTSADYIIENYDIALANRYSIETVSGSFSQSDDIITYTAPNTPNVTSGFSVLGVVKNITILPAIIITPSILVPSNGAIGIGQSTTISASLFAPVGENDTQQFATWQLATDINFNNIIDQSVDDATNLNSWTINGLSPNTTYYTRVKYKGTNLGYSSWSGIVSFRTKSTFITVDISGLTTLITNQTTTYTITNYNSNLEYTLEVNGGFASMQGYTITYTAPAQAGTCSFTVLGTEFTITVIAQQVNKPTILTPTNGTLDRLASVTVTSSAFSSNGGNLNIYHTRSQWQLSKVADFSNIAFDSITPDLDKKITFTFEYLDPDTTYFVRVRYEGTGLGFGPWSDGSSFKTKQYLIMDREIKVFIGPNENSLEYRGSTVLISPNGQYCFVSCLERAGVCGVRDGSVVIYKIINGIWTFIQELFPSSPVNIKTEYGASLACSFDGTALAVGAPMNYTSNSIRSGRVYYYRVDNNGYFTLVSYIQPSPTLEGLEAIKFGQSVALNNNGTLLTVGCPNFSRYISPPIIHTGCFYTYTIGIDNSVNEISRTIANQETLENYDCLGGCMSMSTTGGTLIVGPSVETLTNKVVIFYNNGDGTWSQATSIIDQTISLTNNGVVVPNSVALSANGIIAAVGSPNLDTSGEVTIYSVATGSWVFEAVLTPSNITANALCYGTSLAINGDGSKLVVGAHYPMGNSNSSGRAYTFNKLSGIWTQDRELRGSHESSGGAFGKSISIDNIGGVGIIGAYKVAINSLQFAGTSFIFS